MWVSEVNEDMILGTSQGCHKFPLEEGFKILGCGESSRENVRRCGRKNLFGKQSF